MSDRSETRNWLELPRDVTAAIFSILGPVEILQTLQCVCTLWRGISNDPSLWRTINFDWGRWNSQRIEAICMRAVDRSNGGLVEISVQDFGSDELLAYIGDRSPHLKRLRLVNCPTASDKGLSKAVSQLTELEELEISYCLHFSPVALEAVCCCCPQLKSFKFNCNPNDYDDVISDLGIKNDNAALAIAQHLHHLRHLQLFGNNLTNLGLLAILNGCPHLECLDLRHCLNLNLLGDLKKRCTEQIKHLQGPHDSVQGYLYYANYHAYNSYDDLSGYSGNDGFGEADEDDDDDDDDVDYDNDDFDSFND